MKENNYGTRTMRYKLALDLFHFISPPLFHYYAMNMRLNRAVREENAVSIRGDKKADKAGL